MQAAAGFIVTWFAAWGYAAVVIIAAIDGPVTSFAAGPFVANGSLAFLPTYLCLLLGDVATCIVIFTFGHYFSRVPFVRRMLNEGGVADHVDVVRRLWLTHSAKTMFMSKLAWGMSSAFLVAAGMVGLPWRRFLLLVVAVAASQYLVLLTIATAMGAVIGPADDIFGWLKIIVAVVLAIVILYLLVARRLRKSLLGATKEADSPAGE